MNTGNGVGIAEIGGAIDSGSHINAHVDRLGRANDAMRRLNRVLHDGGASAECRPRTTSRGSPFSGGVPYQRRALVSGTKFR